MKKALAIAAITVFAISLQSCKKDYTCTCTTTTTGNGLNETSTASYTYENMKSKDAETACSANESSTTSLGFTVSSVCSIN